MNLEYQIEDENKTINKNPPKNESKFSLNNSSLN